MTPINSKAVLLIISLIVFSACNKDDEKSSPVSIDIRNELIIWNEADVLVTINTEGLEEAGVVFGSSSEPTIGVDSEIQVSTSMGEHYALLENLVLGSTYYARGYRVEGGEVSYSREVTFTTQNELTFSFLENFSSEGGTISRDGLGFLGVPDNSSLYMVTRENGSTGRMERIIKYDLTTGASETKNFELNGFLSKRLAYLDNTLYVVGGTQLTEYPLDLSTDPSLYQFRTTSYAGHGVDIYNRELIVWGGEFSTGSNPQRITKLPSESEPQEFGELPEYRYYAGGNIVNDSLYIFGGQDDANGSDAKDEIFIISMSTGELSGTLTLPKPIDVTRTTKTGDIIWIAGQISGGDKDDLQAWEIFLGYFDTEAQVVHEIPVDLEGGVNRIASIASVGLDIFIIYGSYDEGTDFIFEGELLQANLLTE